MGAATEIRTTCPYCGVGCGVIARVEQTGQVSVKGDPGHPANFGRLCSKGMALAETLVPEGRLLQPQVGGRVTDWDTALDAVAQGFSRVIAENGPDSVGFYVSGQLLTEDYYLANKLMKGFIGSANIDTNSRLCMASSVAGHRRAFGADVVPCSYEDLERAKLVVLTGSNAAWCHPVLYQRLVQARRDNPDLQVVVIDPRRTATCDIADQHLAVRPGSDALLFNGLLTYLEANGEGNDLYLKQAVAGVEKALEAARASAPDVDCVATGCGLTGEQVMGFYRLFARTERVVTVFSQGINQSTSGTDKVNAIINCHLYTGRIGRPGMGPFSFTGQPNAMGGREVGALANQLVAHMDLEDPLARERVQRFWDCGPLPQRPGLKAVELFEAVESGRVKALWVMATNPAVSLPDGDRVRKALARCELLVVSDCVADTDTAVYADVLLPALAWGEKEGTVTNSERRISRQRAFLPAPGTARSDAWIITEVARRMGHGAAFDYAGPSQVFAEFAALSALDNDGSRCFDIGAYADLDEIAYANLAPRQWPLRAGLAEETPRLFGAGGFPTPDGKARMLAVTPRAPESRCQREFPLVMNSGRFRDQWHTMTRTGRAPRLSAHMNEPCVLVHPDDARQAETPEGTLARVCSALGELLVRVREDRGMVPGQVFVPMHWNDNFASNGCVNTLVAAHVDTVSGQPESKFTPVSVEPYRAAWYGVLLSRRRLEVPDSGYWARTVGQGYWRYFLAGDEVRSDWPRRARELLCSPSQDVGWAEYQDHASGNYRAARLVNGRLESCLFISGTPLLPDVDWLQGLFHQAPLSPIERIAVLAGRAPQGAAESGPVVCACAGVGRGEITRAIRDGGLRSVDALGESLRAGIRCGSCRPELQNFIDTIAAGS